MPFAPNKNLSFSYFHRIKDRSTHTIFRLEWVFLFIAGIFGFTFLVVTPPFQHPDEYNHFYKAYQISEGQFLSVNHDQRTGGWIPETHIAYVEHFRPLIGQDSVKVSDLNSFPERVKDKKTFVDFANTGIYSPVSYFPQSLFMAIARIFSRAASTHFYAGRIGSLFAYLLTIFFVIKGLKRQRWLIIVLAILPMTLSISGAINADVVSNCLAFLIIGQALRLYHDGSWSRKEAIKAALFVALLASAKLVYLPLILVYLIPSAKQYGSMRNKLLVWGGLFTLGMISVIVWSRIIDQVHIPYKVYNVEYRGGSNLSSCSDVAEQSALLKKDPSLLFSSLIESPQRAYEMYRDGYIGTFGWLETKLNPGWISFGYLLILCIVLIDGERFSFINRGVIFASGLAMFSLVIISQLLIWNCVGDPGVQNLQGRYFIPVFPALFLGLSYRFEQTKYFKIAVLCGSVILLVAAETEVIARFY